MNARSQTVKSRDGAAHHKGLQLSAAAHPMRRHPNPKASRTSLKQFANDMLPTLKTHLDQVSKLL